MADALVTFAFAEVFAEVTKLMMQEQAAEEIRLLWHFKDEIERLRNTVSTMEAVLLDAKEKHAAGNHDVRGWLRKLEVATFDLDDMLDAVSTEAPRRELTTLHKMAKQVRIFFSKSNQLAFRLKMAHQINATRWRLEDNYAMWLGLRHVETGVGGNMERATRWRLEHNYDMRLGGVGGNMERDHSCVLAEAVIGREDDKKAVIHRLLDSNIEENVSILPIVGIGGLGKTALAQLIFNDEQIQRHFKPKIWVRVSDRFDVQNMVVKILEAATEKKPEAVEMEKLAGKLKEEIDGKKYLLVLDDVWNEDHGKWSELEEVLRGGAIGSRILVTTRTEIVARISGTVQPYFLRELEEHASWSLFKLIAFERGQEPEENSSIVAIGREILAKCSGVPLAIKTIGGLLRFKNSEAEGRISQTEHDILPTLKSYDHLPSHLKHCFAYCCLFPKDYRFDKSTLIQLWIAQGFVKLSNRNQCLEDVGHEYFMNLLSGLFFQEVETDEFGNITGCKMHDLRHDLAILFAGSLFTTLDAKERNVDKKTRHVSIADCDIDNLSITTSLCEASRIRTLICHPTFNNFWGELDCEAFFSSSKFLRVLDLHGSNLDFLPSSIGKLQSLRYLDLSGNYNIKKLPDSITRLHNLQSLILSKCGSLKELPRDIRKLINLRHLEIDKCYRLTYMPRGLGQLTNLQNLSRFVFHSGHSDSGGLKELGRLTNLRGKLVIENLEHGKDFAAEYEAAKLKEKHHLHALHLWWNSHRDVNNSKVANDEAEGFEPHPNLKYLRLGKYQGSTLPSWCSSLTNLVRFELFWCKKCQYLPPLSQLHSLKYLLLVSLDAMEYISNGGVSNEEIRLFRSLKEISLWKCRNLKGWWRDFSVEINSDSHKSVEITEHGLPPSFPDLSTLSISFCPMLTSMPMFPHLEEQLILNHASLKPLQQTMMMKSSTSTATASSSSTPLSKLKSIQLNSFADLESLPLQNLISLESLTISDCPDEDGMQWQGLTSLPFLRLSRLPKLVSLPLGLQHSTTLQRLEISNCVNLSAIPEWIHNCKSLRELEIRKCSSLVSLPEGMRRLSLQKLTIADCPILVLRCNRETGGDWAKIDHIPNVELS